VRAARLVESAGIRSDVDLAPLFEAAPPDTDTDVLRRLRQMYEAGAWVLLESTLADLPADLRWLFESGAVTLEQLATVNRALGVTTASDFAAAVAEHRIRHLEGFDTDIEAAIGAALPTLRALIPRIPLGRAVAIADPLLQEFRATAGVAWAEATGSLRRGTETVGDIELVASTTQPAEVIERLLAMSSSARPLHRSARRAYVLAERGQVGVRCPEPERAGVALLFLTGPPGHVGAVQAHASATGFRLASTGLTASDGRMIDTPHEDDVYTTLGLSPIPAEIRTGEDEVDRALRGELPRLVAREHIRGDLHMHSTWSDGRDSIEAMAVACRTLGYEYLAITDHSPHSGASRSLTIDSVKQQAGEIAALREEFPDIAILHGCEADILADGRLDFPDEILEQFDIVLASLHDRAGHDRDQLLRRYLVAMRHPLVTIITHPMNRVVPHRAGYDLDYDRLFAAAVESRTAVEVDGAPAHLDLDGALARRAVEAGATIAIDSDCHRSDRLDRQMRLGIVTARRGWVEPRHVLNARPLADLRAFIAAKRAGAA
jgi:DNA polymerase (family 10)